MFSGCNANASLLCDWILAGCTDFGGTEGADAVPDDGVCIQFCIGDQNLPTGEDNIGGLAITVGDYTWPSVPGNTWAGWLNIFVSSTTTAGVPSYFGGVAPISGAANPNGNGAYVDHFFFGSHAFNGCTSGGLLDYNATPYDGGAFLTHELGHYFGLNHTFLDTLSDTPPQNSANNGCPLVNTVTCAATGCSGICNGYAGNFMDYLEDDCIFTFTQDQVDIMSATAANQNQWAVGSVSCAVNYPPCGEANQVGDCAIFCANQVNSLYENKEDICYTQGVYTLPTTYTGLAVDNADFATYTWSTGGYISTGGTPVNTATINLTQPTGCAPVTQTLYLNVGCTDESVSLNAGTSVLTIFPDPTLLTTADIVTFTNGGCYGPIYTLTPGCAPYATVTQNGGPSFPVTLGSGTVNYDITLNYPVDCCEIPGAEILLTGIIGSTTLNDVNADQVCENNGAGHFWTVPFTIPNAQNASSVNTTGLGAIKEICIDLTVQSTDHIAISFGSPDCAQQEREILWAGIVVNGGTNSGPINNVCFTAGIANGEFDGIFDGDDGTTGSFVTCDVNADQWYLYISDYNCFFNDTSGGTLNNATVTFCDGFQQDITGLCDFTDSATYNCSTACSIVYLGILFDNFPGQTSWNIVDAGGIVVASGGNYGGLVGNSTTTESICLQDGCYTLNVDDTFNNGMCPFQSSATGVATFVTPGTLITPGSIVGTLSLVAIPGLCGNYTLTDGAGGALAAGGGAFGTNQSNQFCLSGGLAPRLHQSGTNEIKEIAPVSLEIFPSIATDFITIKYNVNMQNAQLRIVDISGKVLQQHNIEQNSLPSLKIDISEFKAGIKFVQLISADGEGVTGKFLKQ